MFAPPFLFLSVMGRHRTPVHGYEISFDSLQRQPYGPQGGVRLYLM